MLVINYNGNKPTTDYFKYGVSGNKNTDIVRFVLLKYQGQLNLLDNTKVSVKCLDEFDNALEDIEIASEDIIEKGDMLFIDLKLPNEVTKNSKVKMSLSFSFEEDIWQTQSFTLRLMN